MVGVTMLLNRMDSHPEEFAAGNFDAPYREPPDERTRWLNIIWCVRNKIEKHAIYAAGHDNDPMPMLTYEEAKIIYDKWVELQRAAFTGEIMSILTREPVEVDYGRAVPETYVTSPPAYFNPSSPTGRLRTSALRMQMMPTVEEAIESGLVEDDGEDDGNYHEHQQR